MIGRIRSLWGSVTFKHNIFLCARTGPILKLGAVYKRLRTKSQKNWHPSFLSARTGLTLSPLSVGAHHKFRKIRCFCTKKCVRPHLKTPPPSCPQNVRTGQTHTDCGRLLRTAPYCRLVTKSNLFPESLQHTDYRFYTTALVVMLFI